MDFEELKSTLEGLLKECNLYGGSYGEAGWVDGPASPEDIAHEMATLMQRKGLEIKDISA
jgi:hypothetical protein